MRTYFIILLFLAIQNVSAQFNADNSWMSYLEERAENEETEEGYLENMQEELTYLSENPFNINTVTKVDLERLPFLSDRQIENLLYYIYRYAPIVDIYELKNVEDLDRQTIAYLLPFVYVGETENTVDRSLHKNTLKYLKQDLVVGTTFTLQTKAGYQSASAEERAKYPGQHYLGDSQALSFRYHLNSGDKIQFGITGEKDPGERLWDKSNKGLDFYAINLTLKNLNHLKLLSIGDYRLSFGQGLVLNTNFSMGKSSDATNISQKNNGIKRHLSTNESQYFSGFAGTLKFNKVETTFFYSYRNPDATADSSTIYTFKTDGYHRTLNDLEKRKTATVNLYGANVQWKKDKLSVGLTSVYYSFGEKELNPDFKPYHLFTLRGKDHFNAGINYGFSQKKVIFQGETAIDKFGKIATLNHLSVSPVSFLDWVVSYRYYSKDYNALYGKAFAESSTVQNESGFYTGVKIHFLSRWELSAYWDYFTFPWLKYGIDSPSSGNDWLARLSYYPTPKIQMNWLYKRKEKSKNFSSEDGHENAVLPYEQQRLRYQLNLQPNALITLKTQADYNVYQSATENQTGWSLTQTLSYTPNKTKFQVDGTLAYFHAADWDSRIYIYEKNAPYSLGFPVYYGKGLRYYTVVRWKIAKAFTLYLKVASTHYFDRKEIGSGAETIEGREKSDIYCFVKYQF